MQPLVDSPRSQVSMTSIDTALGRPVSPSPPLQPTLPAVPAGLQVACQAQRPAATLILVRSLLLLPV